MTLIPHRILLIGFAFWIWFAYTDLADAVAPLYAQTLVTTGFSATDVISILSALGVLITAVVGGTISIISTLRTNRLETRVVGKQVVDATDKLDIASQKTDGLVSQVAEVHTLTNSNLTAVTSELKMAVQQIQTLTGIIADMKSEREKDALVAAATAPPAKAAAAEAVALAAVPPATDQVTLTASAPVVAALAEAVAGKVIPPVASHIDTASDKLAKLALEALEKKK